LGIEVTLEQLVILSGKGGTGKTSLAAAFAHLAHSVSPGLGAVLVDADVDASNLELMLSPQQTEVHEFLGGSIAVIDYIQCNACGNCEQVCYFDAIREEHGTYSIDPIACDGCAACAYQCPEAAISMKPQIVGQWYRSETRYGPLFHADLFPAQENSGKLVTMVKQNARLMAFDEHYPLIIVDGPPGISCPAISALAGADTVLVVAEPTSAGIHDMQRVLQLARHFRLNAMVCINKEDLHPEGSDQIRHYCDQNQVRLVGTIPYDETIIQAIISGEPVTQFLSSAPSSRAIRQVWMEVLSLLHQEVRLQA
jgi:MinD superfamily P-loop ATPase